MRVCFLSYAPVIGGVSTYQGYHIGYLLGADRVSLADEVPHTSLARVPAAARTSVDVLETPLWTGRAAAQSELRGWFDRYPADVVSISNPGLLVMYPRLLRRLRREQGTRVVLTHHSGILTSTVRRQAMALASSLLTGLVDEVVYVSEFTRRYWAARYPWMRAARSRVVYNGVPLPAAPRAASAPPRTLRVGFVGRVELEKGIDLFCETARLTRAGRDDIEFHVFGDGGWRDEMLRRHGGDVVWHGLVSDDARIYAGVDLLLMTSPVENCPFAVLEAMSMGIPTVAPAVGGLPEVIASGVDGVLTPNRTAAALRDAVERAADAYVRLSAGCLAQRVRFDIVARGAEMWGPYGAAPRRGAAA